MEDESIVIGVDAHKRTHTMVATDAVGRRLAETTVAATTDGHLAALEWAARWPVRRWAVEDCRHLTRTLEGWLFLAVVMDMCSRKIVGWSMRDNLEADLVVDALAMAVTRRKPASGLVHHSDRGRSTGRWRSGGRCASPGWSPRWAPAVMRSTTPPAKAASRR